MGKPRTWTDSDLEIAVSTSQSIAQVLRSLGLNATGGNYKSIQIHIERLALSTAHFKGQGWNRGRSNPHGIPLSEILVEGSTYRNTSTLKGRLIKAGMLVDQCDECGIGSQWNGRPLKLQLDHINGKNRDHRIENLRVLCPNCHSQTDTFCRPKGA